MPRLTITVDYQTAHERFHETEFRLKAARELRAAFSQTFGDGPIADTIANLIGRVADKVRRRGPDRSEPRPES